MTRSTAVSTLAACAASLLLSGARAIPDEVEPADAPTRKDVRAFSAAAVAWDVDLASTPLAPPMLVRGHDGERVLVLAMPGSIEARAAADGALVWRREGLAGAGLYRPLDAPRRPPAFVGWAGTAADGSHVVSVLSAADGSDLATHRLPAPPAGPPLPVADRSGATHWHVPVDGGRVITLDAGLNTEAETETGEDLKPPLVSFLGRIAAFVGEPTELRPLDGSKVRRAPRGIAPATATVRDEWLFGASRHRVCAWNCRTTRRERLSCRRRWCQELGASVTAPPRVHGELLVVGSWDTFLYAFQLENGHLRWRVAEGQRLTRPALPWRSLLLVIPEASPRITAIDPDSGEIVSRLRGEPEETFPVGGAVAGELLVVPVTRRPSSASLRAWSLAGDADDSDVETAGVSRSRGSASGRGLDVDLFAAQRGEEPILQHPVQLVGNDAVPHAGQTAER